MSEAIEKLAISFVAFAFGVVLRLLFKEFRSKKPEAATEELIRRLFRRRQKDAPSPKLAPTTSVAGRSGKLVTMFAEAAFDADRKLGAWSSWARDGARTVQRSAMFGKHIHTRDHASIEALHAGIRFVVEEFGLKRGDLVVAQAASEHAVDVLSGRKPLRVNRLDEATTLVIVKELASEKGISFSFKHIHDPGGDVTKRSRASLVCERTAQRVLENYLAQSGAERGANKQVIVRA